VYKCRCAKQLWGTLTVMLSMQVDHESISKAIGTLGGTGLRLLGLDSSELADGLFIPVAEVKEARRAAVDALIAERTRHGVAQGPQTVLCLKFRRNHQETDLRHCTNLVMAACRAT
jgi:hypothetical protein